MKILVVDDDPTSQMSLVHLALKTYQNASVDTANTYGEAVHKVRGANYSLVLLDYWLDDGKTGLDVAKYVHPQTPVVVVSGRGTDRLLEEVEGQGGVKVVRKGDWDGLAQAMLESTPVPTGSRSANSLISVTRTPDGSLVIKQPKKWLKVAGGFASAFVAVVISIVSYSYGKGGEDTALKLAVEKNSAEIHTLRQRVERIEDLAITVASLRTSVDLMIGQLNRIENRIDK